MRPCELIVLSIAEERKYAAIVIYAEEDGIKGQVINANAFLLGEEAYNFNCNNAVVI